MRITRPQRAQIAESVLPMINVVFLLLIFFMLAGALTSADIFEIDPPESDSADPALPSPALLLLDAEGRLALDAVIIDDRSLTHVIAARLESEPDTDIHLKADAEVPTERVVAVMQALLDAGVDTVTLKTLASDR